MSRNRESAFRVISPNKNLPLKSFDDYAAKNGVTSQHAHHHDLAVLRFLAGEQPQKTFEEGTSALQQEMSQQNFAKNLADFDNSCYMQNCTSVIRNDTDKKQAIEQDFCDQVSQQVAKSLLQKRDEHRYDVASFVADREVKNLLQILLDLPSEKDREFLHKIRALQNAQQKLMQTQHRTYQEVRQMQEQVDFIIDYLERNQLKKFAKISCSEQELSKILEGKKNAAAVLNYIHDKPTQQENLQELTLAQRILLGDQNDFAQKVNTPTPPPVPLKKSTSSDTSVVLKHLADELCRLREDLSRPVPTVQRGNQTSQDDYPQPYRRDSSYHDARDCMQQNFEKSFVAAPPVDLTRDGCDVSAAPLQIVIMLLITMHLIVSHKILKKVLRLQHR